MLEASVQILEVRAARPERPVTITAAIAAPASQAIFTALREQLDRRRTEPATSVEAVEALREQATLVERFEPLAAAEAHAIVSVSDVELRACLLELSDYTNRVDGEHFQPPELRARLELIGEITPVLWDANAQASAAARVAGEALAHSAS